MMQTIDLRDGSFAVNDLRRLVPRAVLDTGQAIERVKPLVEEVRTLGEAGLRRQAEVFDSVSGHSLRVPKHEISEACESASDDLVRAMSTAIDRLRLASVAQVPHPQVTILDQGARIEQRWQPVERVGLYVPGGKAVYPSSVLMNAVAAQSAGVSSLAIASPAQASNGTVHPTILAAASLLGVDEVYAIGGAGAIAAFAYGVPEIGLDPVDVVTGPGNIFVAAAKRIVNGIVGIDAEAGTTEILIIADDSANPTYVAADLLSQAEHDEAAASILVTDSVAFAESVATQVRQQVSHTLHSERASTALAGPQSGIILVSSLEEAAAVSNAYAPEHLEIQTRENERVLAGITHAGAIFVGQYTPVSLGDYLAGSNHVLPTGGTARFSSGLGAHTFLRAQQIIHYDRSALHAVHAEVSVFAEAEGLPAHGEAVAVRFDG